MANWNSLFFLLSGISSWFACSFKPSLVQDLSTADTGGRENGKRGSGRSKHIDIDPKEDTFIWFYSLQLLESLQTGCLPGIFFIFCFIFLYNIIWEIVFLMHKEIHIMECGSSLILKNVFFIETQKCPRLITYSGFYSAWIMINLFPYYRQIISFVGHSSSSHLWALFRFPH